MQRREAWTAKGPLIVILIAFAGLCLAYSATVPLGEAPDELAHYRYVRYIDQEGRPPLTAEDRLNSGYKGHEPPLYYLLLHRVTGPLRIAQQPMLKLLDPDREPQHSIASEVMLWNAVLHTADEAFPWRGTSLAWHLMRLLSIPLGMVTILCTYSVVRQLAPARPWLAWLAAGMNAFTPQFVYISAVLNNDNLAVPLSVVSLWILARMARGDLRWRWFVLLGVIVGLARITKFYTLILVPIVWLALLMLAWRLKNWRRCLLGGLLVMALILAISAPWITAVQPDDPATAPGGALGFALKMLDILHTDRILRSRGMSASGGSAEGLSAWVTMVLSFFRLEPRRWLGLLFKSFWAYYGPMTIEAPVWFYGAMLILTLAALVGLGRLVWRYARHNRPGVLGQETGLVVVVLGLQAAAFVLLEALFYTIMRRLPDTAQGRHLYSAMPAWMFLLALGIAGWLPATKGSTNGDGPERISPRARWTSLILPGLLFGLSTYALPAIVLAAYEPALPVRTSLPARWRPPVILDQASAPGITLVGYGPPLSQGSAEQQVTLHTVWRAGQVLQEECLLRLAAVDVQGAAYTLYLAQPLNGRWPTRAWDPGDYIFDAPTFSIPAGMAEGRYTLRCAWVTESGQGLGTELDMGILDIRPAEARASSPPQLVIEGLRDGALSYRQSLVTTETGPAQQLAEPPAGSQIVGPDGQAWLPLAQQMFTAQQGITTVRSFYLVTGRVRPGRYQIRASLASTKDGETQQDAVEVRGRVRAFDLPQGYLPLQASLGQHIELLGYRIEGAVWPKEAHPVLGQHYAALHPGQTLNLLLAWRAAGWVPRSYTVFTHLLDERTIVRAQHDQVPRFDYATLFWVPGEVVTDLYHLSLPPDAPTGVYQIEVGMYERLSGDRLAVSQDHGAADTRVVLPPILVQATAATAK